MTNVNFTSISDGTILLQGEDKDSGVIIVKQFATFDEAIEYADNFNK